MEFLKTTKEDIDAVFDIYNEATAYQKTVNIKSWRGFEKSLIEKEIEENRHFIIREEDEIACTFVLTFNDLIIWKEAAADPAVYIHRIATNPKFRGRSYVKKIIEWVKTYAKENGKTYIRLDTHSGNERINKYYTSCGFDYKGISVIEWTAELPEHYKEGSFSLFEIKL
ncbi:GNAT family N-acetyltransferase [Flavobacterium circumlabens]|uniref:GNAT family N-acetyltransferase n=1 Tax=Flavobacterium circumlabens TaxID=2133765 RepID=A0A4Y7UJQ9_9FLAO|nr:GNAT family N-acetyltransferase [Flavobacterium circumlabens]TCN60914.1 ribosomal protein S18 acetylase RimI-like enzyme [Flavobacterium circumlabens]TEB46032.1 GNAT family N-acetyltransferase [Flavobacterium circumlabens]